MFRTSIAVGGLAAAFSLAGAAIAQPPAPSKFEAVFQARCAGCHEPHVERAPARADIAQMAPGQIVGALQGVMAPMAAGLSNDDIQGLAAYLGASPQKLATAPQPSAATILATVPPHPASAPSKPFEWRAYGGGDYASNRYAPLDQINKDTVKYLHVAWRQSLTPDVVRQAGPGVPVAPNNNETTPLMVGGLVYFSTGIGGVAALDAATGKVVWHVDHAVGGDGPLAVGAGDGDGVAFGAATRSLTYWPDGKDGRIIALIGNKYLTALNAKTGQRIGDFGANGQVDLRQGQMKGQTTFSWKTGPTVIVRGVVIIGSYVTDINSARSVSKKSTPRGDVRGIDARC
jgi:quinoprotein glucose dehydrogenase